MVTLSHRQQILPTDTHTHTVSYGSGSSSVVLLVKTRRTGLLAITVNHLLHKIYSFVTHSYLLSVPLCITL